MNLKSTFRTNYDKYAEIDLCSIIREKEDLLCKLILKQMVGLEVFKLSKNINFSSLLYHLQKKKIHLTRRYYLITKAALLTNFPLDYNRSITHLRKVSQLHIVQTCSVTHTRKAISLDFLRFQYLADATPAPPSTNLNKTKYRALGLSLR